MIKENACEKCECTCECACESCCGQLQGGSMSMKQALDKGLNKIISRKLLSWITASTFLCLGFINNEQWTAITIGYVGIQGFADLAATWKHGK